MLNKQEKRIWETPLYADFPRNEYEDRVRRARGYMAERNLDVLVMWDPANIRYFSGFHSLHWSSLTISPAVCSGVHLSRGYSAAAQAPHHEEHPAGSRRHCRYGERSRLRSRENRIGGRLAGRHGCSSPDQ
jgi:Xaa-Pro aminopeptidase